MHIHLDPVGGLAGDMFLAAVLHAWPEMEEPVFSAMRTAGLPKDWSVEAVAGSSAGITGMRVKITGDAGHHHHATGSFRQIKERLQAAGLASGVLARAIAIFQLLAEAEGEIHGKPIDQVHFHEIADWDSIADIVGAAAAIEAIGASGWSVGDLPMGAGTVMTAHGRLPVPAPATALLLRGYRLVDDGLPGERVTPTGAAILAHLEATQTDPIQTGRRPGGRLARTGHGLGTRELKGAPNMVRLLAFDDAAPRPTGDGRRVTEVGVISFEVDDQTPEDLAAGIEHLRASHGVLDVVQSTVTGKKGRIAISLRLLCRVEEIEPVIEACFVQTTTIGLRWRIEQRVELAREDVEIEVTGLRLGAKTVARPGANVTTKVDMDAVARQTGTQAERARLRRAVEGHDDDAN
ncbi:MAG: LarC family nickel insertion protein [Proteobacteria bacterium]|nr:LarC family nickel insertion protein [Pseudomonadota bacterium]